jgi:hypothetical protein
MLLLWKRWGFYALLSVKAVVAVIYLSYNSPVRIFINEGVEVAILTAFMIYLWKRFDLPVQ